MRQDFTTRLELQLIQAATTPRVARRTVPWRLVAAGAAVGLAVLAAVLGAAALRDHDTPPAHPGPRVIAHNAFVSQGGTVASGFGAVWAADTGTGQILRVDPRTRAVEARIAVGGPATAVSTGAGAVWAVGTGGVARIDPKLNRVVARISVPGLRAGAVVAADSLWLVDSEKLSRIDPRRNAVDRTIATSRRGFQNVDVSTDGRSIFLMRGDGRLLRFDARTGERLASVRMPITGFPHVVSSHSVVLEGDTGVVAVDPGTGGTQWTRDLGAQSVNYSVLAGRTLWVQATDRATHRDRLWRVDARTGRLGGSVALPAFGAAGMTAVGGQVWIVSVGGDLVVAR